MRKLLFLLMAVLMLSGCEGEPIIENEQFDGVSIVLSNNNILVDGELISNDTTSNVYSSNSIIYYEEGHDETYGEGTTKDSHSVEEANKHTVVTITQPGNYQVSGELSYGQIVIDLGEEAKEDGNAVVNLFLNNVDITSTVAPAIVVYNAYECGTAELEKAVRDVDTSKAGFNLIIKDDSYNEINGSYVAKIYKEGTTKKLHKYDAAIDSKVSFTIDGEVKDNGVMIVNAENEGVSSNLHLTINGGNITINSSDDAINTNEDGISVLTINSGTIICDSGLGKEGDGIDSNGWIVVNGGYLVTSANGQSMDSGLDADNGIYLNGGTILGSGNMYDEVSNESNQNFIVLNFNTTLKEDDIILIKDSNDNPVTAFKAANAYSILVYSSNTLVEGEYTLYKVNSVSGTLNGNIYTNIESYENAVQLAHSASMMNQWGNPFNGNFDPSKLPEGFDTNNKDWTKNPNGQRPNDFNPNNGNAPQMPENFDPSKMENQGPPMDRFPGNMSNVVIGEQEVILTIQEKANIFYGISEYQANDTE